MIYSLALFHGGCIDFAEISARVLTCHVKRDRRCACHDKQADAGLCFPQPLLAVVSDISPLF